MPIIKSAKKRVKVAQKATVRNAKTKRSLKSAIKLFGKKTDAKNHSAAQSQLDRAVKKGVLHKNKAARLKKRLAAQAKAANVKPTATKKTTTKPAAKPATKSVAKKPVTKKPATKKPAAKKPAAKK